jgi:hypothetical protein
LRLQATNTALALFPHGRDGPGGAVLGASPAGFFGSIGA